MFRNVYSVGILLFVVIFSAFLVTNIFFRNVHYYKYSILLNAFFVPAIFCLGSLFSVIKFKNWKKNITFKEAYGRSFFPMFIGGVLSVFSIYIYITWIDPSTKDLLNHQYIESFKNSLETEYKYAKQVTKPNSEEMKELERKYTEAKERIAHKISKKEDMFSFRYFLYVFAGYSAFFLILSLFFGSFFRSRTP